MLLPLVGAGAANAAVADTTQQLKQVKAPQSLVENAFESDTTMWAINEKQDVRLRERERVDFKGPGSVTADDARALFIPAGTVVDSHILHADPKGGPKVPSRLYKGSVTFDSEILGVVILASSLDGTDVLGAPRTTYPTGNGTRGLENGDLVISENRQTITVKVNLHRLDQIRVITRGEKPEQPGAGAEGCTPGFWKQPHHFDSWTGFTPRQSFLDVFGVDLPGSPTLLEALQTGGGGKAALGRHAVAALLNASSTGVDYAFTAQQVIDLVQTALAPGGDVEATKNRLAAANEEGCPLS